MAGKALPANGMVQSLSPLKHQFSRSSRNNILYLSAIGLWPGISGISLFLSFF